VKYIIQLAYYQKFVNFRINFYFKFFARNFIFCKSNWCIWNGFIYQPVYWNRLINRFVATNISFILIYLRHSISNFNLYEFFFPGIHQYEYLINWLKKIARNEFAYASKISKSLKTISENQVMWWLLMNFYQ